MNIVNNWYEGLRHNQKVYMIVDTETTSPNFTSRIAMEEGVRKNIAIAKPLIYDFGYVIVTTSGKVLKKANHLVNEIFGAPDLMNLAFYSDRIPFYMECLENGSIDCLPWNDIFMEFLEDASHCNAICAYNAAFDFKKAFPYTLKYLTAMSGSMDERFKFIKGQTWHCQMIAQGKRNPSTNPKYLTPVLSVNGYDFPIIDLWDVACKRLINIRKYKQFCLENQLWSDSVLYFKTSAETSFRYLAGQYDFDEKHTALADAEIEAFILIKGLRKGKIEPCMGAFPFRELGTTAEFCASDKMGEKYSEDVYNAMTDYLNRYINSKGENSYTSRYMNLMGLLG